MPIFKKIVCDRAAHMGYWPLEGQNESWKFKGHDQSPQDKMTPHILDNYDNDVAPPNAYT